MRIIAGNTERASVVSQAQGFAKKLTGDLKIGHYYTLWLPITEFNGKIAVKSATQPARKLDFEIFGKELIPIDDFVQDEVTDKITDMTPLDKYCRISSVIFKGRELNDIEEARLRMERTAIATKSKVDTAQLERIISEIKMKYEGGKVNGQKIMPTYTMAIKPFYCYTSTAGVIVDMGTPSDVKVDDVLSVRFLDLSENKIRRLREIVQGADEIDKSRGYIELSFKYIGADTKEAGRGAFDSISHVGKNDKLCNSHSAVWKTIEPAVTSMVPSTDMAIAVKNPKLKTVDVSEVIGKFKEYVKSNILFMTHIPLEKEVLKSSAKTLLEEFSDEVSRIDDLHSFLLDLVKENVNVTRDESSTLEGIETFKGAISATNLEELANKTNDLDDYSKLNPNNEDEDEDGFNSTDSVLN